MRHALSSRVNLCVPHLSAPTTLLLSFHVSRQLASRGTQQLQCLGSACQHQVFWFLPELKSAKTREEVAIERLTRLWQILTGPESKHKEEIQK
jgi:hypothetical protein